MDLNNKVINEKPAIVWTGTNALQERLDSYYYNPTFIKQYSKMMNGNMGVIGNYFNVTKLSGFEYTKYFTEEALRKGEVVAITSQNVADCQLNIKEGNTIKIPKKLHLELKRSRLNSNDIVLSYTGHYRRAAVISDEVNKELHLGPNVCKLSPIGTNIDSAYLCAYFNSYSGQVYLDREKTISAQPTVNMDRIRNIEFPLPDIRIQKFIGDKVRKAEELRNAANGMQLEIESIFEKELVLESIYETDNGKKYAWVESSLINERIDAGYFSNKYLKLDELEKNYSFVPLSKIVLELKTGKTPSQDEDDKNGTVLIAVNNVVPNDLEIEKNARRVKIGDNLFLTQADDLLITRVGTVGVCSVVESYQKGFVLSDNVIAAKLIKNDIPIRYIAAYLNSPTGRLQIERIVKGAVQPVINYQSIKELKVPKLGLNSMNKIDSLIMDWKENLLRANKLINEAKLDVDSLIEGNINESKIIEIE